MFTDIGFVNMFKMAALTSNFTNNARMVIDHLSIIRERTWS